MHDIGDLSYTSPSICDKGVESSRGRKVFALALKRHDWQMYRQISVALTFEASKVSRYVMMLGKLQRSALDQSIRGASRCTKAPAQPLQSGTGVEEQLAS